MLSKLFMSINAQYKRFFSFNIFCITAFKTKIASTVERPFRKPNCASLTILLFSAQPLTLLFKTEVKILEKMLNICLEGPSDDSQLLCLKNVLIIVIQINL